MTYFTGLMILAVSNVLVAATASADSKGQGKEKSR